jgi:hypothetical protein
MWRRPFTVRHAAGDRAHARGSITDSRQHARDRSAWGHHSHVTIHHAGALQVFRLGVDLHVAAKQGNSHLFEGVLDAFFPSPERTAVPHREPSGVRSSRVVVARSHVPRSGGFVAPNDHACDRHRLRKAISPSAIAGEHAEVDFGAAARRPEPRDLAQRPAWCSLRRTRGANAAAPRSTQSTAWSAPRITSVPSSHPRRKPSSEGANSSSSAPSGCHTMIRDAQVPSSTGNAN